MASREINHIYKRTIRNTSLIINNNNNTIWRICYQEHKKYCLSILLRHSSLKYFLNAPGDVSFPYSTSTKKERISETNCFIARCFAYMCECASLLPKVPHSSSKGSRSNKASGSGSGGYWHQLPVHLIANCWRHQRCFQIQVKENKIRENL